jgi:predicted dehydrogenase
MALRIGIVGLGFGARVHIPSFQSEGLEVVAVCSRHHDRAAAVAERFAIPEVFTDFAKMLAMEDLDAVSIVTPPQLHYSMTLDAIAAGKHLICEKPFALTLTEAREMSSRAITSGLTAMVAHEFRFSSGRAFVADLVREGRVGTPLLGEVRLFRGPTAPAGELPEYRASNDRAALGGGLLFSPGSHYLDAVRHWFGEVVAVEGSLLTIAPLRRDGGETISADADDTLHVALICESGATVLFSGSKATPFQTESSMRVIGDDGTILTPQSGPNPPARGEVLFARQGDERFVPLEVPARYAPIDDPRDERMAPFRLFVRSFLAGLASGTSPAPNFLDALRCQEIMSAIRLASHEQRRVAIAELVDAVL